MISFRLWGTEVCLHFSFFAMLCLYFQLEQGESGIYCLMAAIIHEAGHLLAFTMQKAAPRQLHFQLGGIRLVPPDEPLPFSGEFFTLAAGGMTSLLCGCFLYLMNSSMAPAHFLTGIFSLLPLPGLDGGEIVSLFQSRFFPDKEHLFRTAGRLLAASAALFLTVANRPGGLIPAAAILLAALLKN